MRKLTSLIVVFIFFIKGTYGYAYVDPSEATAVHDGIKHYYIINDKNFTGSAVLNRSNNTVDFYIANIGKNAFNFKGAEYRLVTEHETKPETYDLIYGLEFNEIYNPHYPIKSVILNPKEGVVDFRITCYAPEICKYLKDGKIQGFSIQLENEGIWPGRKIRFGYEVLHIEQKLWRFILKMYKKVIKK